MKKFKLLALLLVHNFQETRNPRRSYDDSIPCIIVSSNNKNYVLKNRFLRHRALKQGFDPVFFDTHFISNSTINFRDKSGSVSGFILQQLMEELVKKILSGHKKFNHFKVLKDKDFNYKTKSGLIVLKFNLYPFVVKLSMEHPHTLICPPSNSIEAFGRFVVGGHLRHFMNFTRITNLEQIKTLLSYHPFYLKYLDFPRKWYWKPHNSPDLIIQWSCKNQEEMFSIPEIYAVVSDFIESEPNQPQNDLNKLSMKIASDTGFLIDPHSGNIVIEKNSRNYVLLDTENFRIMAGLNKNMKAKKYSGWILELMGKGLKTVMFRTKQERLNQTLSD